MLKRSLALAVILATPLSLFPLLDLGNKTYYALPRIETWQCQETALWHTHTTTDLNNPLGLSFQTVPFYTKAVRTEPVAKTLTSRDSEKLLIASDRYNEHGTSLLPYHAIVANPALDAEEATATLLLYPSFDAIGATFSLFYDASANFPGLSLLATMPVYYATTILNTLGATRTIGSFFDGTFSQEEPKQAALAYGLFGKHRHTLCGPLTLMLRYNCLESERSYVTLFAGGGINLKKKPIQTHLFDYHSAAYDHHKLLTGVEAGATIYQSNEVSTELVLQAHYNYLIPGTENRILGLLDDDGSAPVFSSYLPGAQEGVAGVFPLANVLHQPVHRCALHQATIASLFMLHWNDLTATIGYELTARSQEQLTVSQWPTATYAIASPLYNTTDPFSNSSASTATVDSHSILLNHRFITKSMLNLNTAASNAQVSCTLSAGAGYNAKIMDFPISFGGGITYQNGFNDATLSLFGCWLKAVISL